MHFDNEVTFTTDEYQTIYDRLANLAAHLVANNDDLKEARHLLKTLDLMKETHKYV